jgi:hypothetical protein
MKLVIDADEILKELSKKPDRKQTSLYLSEGVYKQFQKDCDDTPPSQVVEMLMKLFSESKRTNREKK